MQLYSVVNQRNVSPWGSSVSGTCSFCRGDPTRSCKDWDCETLSTPTDATSVGQFLDLASYYRRFVPSFATVAAPLHTFIHWLGRMLSPSGLLIVRQHLQSWKNCWPQHQFWLTPNLVQNVPHPGDWCWYLGTGCSPSRLQVDGTTHLIAYASHSVDKHERNYGISELETLGIVWVVRYFQPYLLGHPSIVYTDHAACLSILIPFVHLENLHFGISQSKFHHQTQIR